MSWFLEIIYDLVCVMIVILLTVFIILRYDQKVLVIIILQYFFSFWGILRHYFWFLIKTGYDIAFEINDVGRVITEQSNLSVCGSTTSQSVLSSKHCVIFKREVCRWFWLKLKKLWVISTKKNKTKQKKKKMYPEYTIVWASLLMILFRNNPECGVCDTWLFQA